MLNAPLRQQTGVNYRVAPFGVHHPASAQPVDQLARIARVQHVIESIVLAPALESFVLRDEMQVVIAEYRERALAELAHIAQHVERFRAAIDQVAYKP